MTKFAEGQAEFKVIATDDGVDAVANKLKEVDNLLNSIQSKSTIKIDFGKGSSIRDQKSLISSFTRFLKQVSDMSKKTGNDINENLNLKNASDKAKKETDKIADNVKNATNQGKNNPTNESLKEKQKAELEEQRRRNAEYEKSYARNQQMHLDVLQKTLAKSGKTLKRDAQGFVSGFKLDDDIYDSYRTDPDTLQNIAGKLLGPLSKLDLTSLSRLKENLNKDQKDILARIIKDVNSDDKSSFTNLLSDGFKEIESPRLEDIFDDKRFQETYKRAIRKYRDEYEELVGAYDKEVLSKANKTENEKDAQLPDTFDSIGKNLESAKKLKEQQDKVVENLGSEMKAAGDEDILISVGIKESPTIDQAIKKLDEIQEKAKIRAKFIVDTENIITKMKNEFKSAAEAISTELGNIKIPEDSSFSKNLKLLKEIKDDLKPDEPKDDGKKTGSKTQNTASKDNIDPRFKSGIVKTNVSQKTNASNLTKAYNKAFEEVNNAQKKIDFAGLDKLLKPLAKDAKYEKSVAKIRDGISKFKKTLKPEFDSSLLEDFAGQDAILSKFQEMKSSAEAFSVARKKYSKIAYDKKLLSDLNKVSSQSSENKPKDTKAESKEPQTTAPVEVKLSPTIEELSAQIDSLNNKTITLNVQFGEDGKGLEDTLKSKIKEAKESVQKELDKEAASTTSTKANNNKKKSVATSEDRNAAKLKRLQSQYDALFKGPSKQTAENLTETMTSSGAYDQFADNFRKYVEASNKSKKDSKYKIPKSVYKSLMDSLDYSMISKENYAGSLADYFKSGMSVESLKGGQKKMSRADIRRTVAEARETYLGMLDKDIQNTQAKVSAPVETPATKSKKASGGAKATDTSIAELNQQIAQLDNKPINLSITTTPEISSLSQQISTMGDTPVKINIEANPESLTGIKESIKSATDGLKLDLDLSSLTDAVTELKKSQNDGEQIQQQTEAILRDEFDKERSSIVQKYEGQVNELKSELQTIKTSLEDTTKKNVEDQTQPQIEALQKQNAELAGKLQESQQKVLEMQASLTSLVDQANNSDSQSDALVAQLNAMNEFVTTLRGQLETIQDNAGERNSELLQTVNNMLSQIDAQRLTAEQRVHLKEMENAGRNQRSADRVQIGAQRVEAETQKTQRSQHTLEGKIATAEAQKEVAAKVLETTVAQTAGAVKIVEASRDSQVKVLDKQIELSDKQTENQLKIANQKEKASKKEHYREQTSEEQKHKREIEKLEKKNEGSLQVAKEKADAQRYASDQRVKMNDDNLAYKKAEFERKEEIKAAKEAEKTAAQNKYDGKIDDYFKLLKSWGFDKGEILSMSKEGKAELELTQRTKNEQGLYDVTGQRYSFSDFGEAVTRATNAVEGMSGSFTEEQKNAKLREEFLKNASEAKELRPYTEKPTSIAKDPRAKVPQRMEGLFKSVGLESMKAGDFRVVDNKGETGVVFDYDFGDGLKSYMVDSVKSILNSDEIGGLVDESWLNQYATVKEVLDQGLFKDTIKAGQDWKNAEARVRDLNNAIGQLGGDDQGDEISKFYQKERDRQIKQAKDAKQQYRSGLQELDYKNNLGDEERRRLISAGDKTYGPKREYQNFFASEEARNNFGSAADDFINMLVQARDNTRDYLTDMVYPAKGKTPEKSRLDTYNEAISNLQNAKMNVMYGNVSPDEYEKHMAQFNKAMNDSRKMLNSDIARKNGSLGEFLYTMNQDGSSAMKNQKSVRDSIEGYLRDMGASNVKVGRSKGKNFEKGMNYNVAYTRDGMDYKDVIRATSYNTTDKGQRLRFDRSSTSGTEHVGGMQKWMSNVGRKFASLSEFITGARMVDTIFAQAQQGFSFVKSLDSQLANINMTMSVTDEQLKAIGKSSIGLGEELSTNASNVLDAVTIYANANESADSIIQKAKPTVMLANAAGVDTATSANWIQSVLRSRL